VDGNDVGLVVPGAGKPPDVGPGQDLETFVGTELVDEHQGVTARSREGAGPRGLLTGR
jgi:hypothetical protein